MKEKGGGMGKSYKGNEKLIVTLLYSLILGI